MVLFSILFIGIAVVAIPFTVGTQYLGLWEKINPTDKWGTKNINIWVIPLLVIILVMSATIAILALDDRSMGGSLGGIAKNVKELIDDAKNRRNGVTLGKLNITTMGTAVDGIIQMSHIMQPLFLDAYGITELENANQLVQNEISGTISKFANYKTWLNALNSTTLPPNCDLAGLDSCSIPGRLEVLNNKAIEIHDNLKTIKNDTVSNANYEKLLGVEGNKQMDVVKKYIETALPDMSKMLDQFESDINMLDTSTREKWFKQLNTKTPLFGTGNNFKIVICLGCSILLLNAIYTIFCALFVNEAHEELTNSMYVSELVTFVNCLCLIGTSVVDLLGEFKCDLDASKLRVRNFTTPFSTSTGRTLETCLDGQKTLFEYVGTQEGIYKSLHLNETLTKLLDVTDPWRITTQIAPVDPTVINNIKTGIQHMTQLLKNKCVDRLQAGKLSEYRKSLDNFLKIYQAYEPYLVNYNGIASSGSSVSPRVSYWFYAKALPMAEDQISAVADRAFAGDISCQKIVDSFSSSARLVCLPYEAPFDVFWPYMIVAVITGVVSLIVNKFIFKNLPEEKQKPKDVESGLPPTSPPVPPLDKGKNPAVPTTMPAPTTTPNTATPGKGNNPVAPVPTKPGIGMNPTQTTTPTTSSAPKGTSTTSTAPTKTPTTITPGKGKNPAPKAATGFSIFGKGKKSASTKTPTTSPALTKTPPTIPPNKGAPKAAPALTILGKGKNPAPKATPTASPALTKTPTMTPPNKGAPKAAPTPTTPAKGKNPASKSK